MPAYNSQFYQLLDPMSNRGVKSAQALMIFDIKEISIDSGV